MYERENRVPLRRRESESLSAHDQSGPTRIADDILKLQRLAGNNAVASVVVQRDAPTRAENIAALKRELVEAEPDPAKWLDVALRLNGFSKGDLPTICALIPDTQLQAARSAVERHLAGWPAQPAILKAIDGRATKQNVSLRPLGGSIWAAYSQVGYNVWHGEDMKNNVWEHIGGSVGKKYAGGNTCAARVSWSFNYGGYPVSGAGEPNKASIAYKGKNGDGKNYIVWVPSLQNYLTSRWGTPDATLNTNSEATAFEALLNPNEVAVFAGPHHSGLIKQGYSDAYVKSDPGVMPVAVWKLPL